MAMDNGRIMLMNAPANLPRMTWARETEPDSMRRRVPRSRSPEMASKVNSIHEKLTSTPIMNPQSVSRYPGIMSFRLRWELA